MVTRFYAKLSSKSDTRTVAFDGNGSISLVDRRIVIENKATERLAASDHARLLNYLEITRYQVGLILHFGPSPRFYKYIDTPKRSIRADSCASVRIRDQKGSKRRGRQIPRASWTRFQHRMNEVITKTTTYTRMRTDRAVRRVSAERSLPKDVAESARG